MAKAQEKYYNLKIDDIATLLKNSPKIRKNGGVFPSSSSSSSS